MTVSEVRKRYLAFFKARGHVIIPSAPIVPGNDPTTLFTSSGMQPLIPYLLGKDHPEGKRVTDSQLSFRAGDIEEVGDNRHTTFFEMLGNWSLGDYFKKEQLPWFFEFMTNKDEGLGLDPSKLYVTVFAGDEVTGMEADTEAVEIWKELFKGVGIDADFASIGSEAAGYEHGINGNERIFAYDAKKNWWSRSGVPANMPAGEPGGPDSEVFYDFAPNTGYPGGHLEIDSAIKWGTNCHPNCDCGRFVEVGNSVFMQFIKNADGSFSNLPKQNVDFGGGLERLTAATQNNSDVFLIDVFSAAREEIERHAFEFSNSGQPIYVKYGSSEEVTKAFRVILDHVRAATFMIADGVKPSNTDAGYVLRRLIRRAVRYADSLYGGIQGRTTINSPLTKVAQTFVDAYAFGENGYSHLAPALNTIIEEIGEEEKRFRITLERGLKELGKMAIGLWQSSDTFGNILETGAMEITGENLFTLYSTYGFPFEVSIEEINKIRSHFKESYKTEPLTEIEIAKLKEGFDKEMKKHQEESRAGAAQKFAGGLADHSEQTVRYHTTHHILLKALQTVLGDEVKQRGSNITSERLRIDFSSPGKMTDEQKAEVERIVNEVIYQDLPVTRTVMPKSEAEKLGAQMEFGVKYPDMVSVYSVGPIHATEEAPDIPNAFSLEFCGGPHVTNTKEIHEGGTHFKIQKEEAVAAGIRRIKAVMQ